MNNFELFKLKAAGLTNLNILNILDYQKTQDRKLSYVIWQWYPSLKMPFFLWKSIRPIPQKTAGEQKIELHKNFRSRAQVLESVNYIFRRIMGEDLGGITYDDNNALYPGADFPEVESF